MRLAIFFTPPEGDPLTRAAARWLGRDAFSGQRLDREPVEGRAGGELDGRHGGIEQAAVAVMQAHGDLVRGLAVKREAVGRGCAAHALEPPAVADLECDAVPDADLHDARLPVPGVVEARLPVLELRRVVELPEPARRQVEHDLERV
ncbi:MAG: hypothetical protein F9K43_07090 [Bauldia sp.]|nr:MAG: hypothetical protein F9K43_07090 [Bauldia sp.]